jgi:hypothetical protein
MSRRPRCQYCEGVIRAYETVILIADVAARRTSTDAAAGSGDPAGQCSHGACYTVVAGSSGRRVDRRKRLGRGKALAVNPSCTA